MRDFIVALLLSGAVLLSWPALSDSSSSACGQSIVTASQVNGTWRSRYGTFKVWALGNQKLRVDFSGFYEYQSPQGPTANTGEGSGIALIEGDTAIFKPEGAEDECQIKMKFTGGKLIVSQEGICGFGQNVSAAGTYRKVSSRKPKFNAS
ncbi:MAG TPA: hypothetical protein VF553_16100 [Pyrinomonadaceae bacterium]